MNKIGEAPSHFKVAEFRSRFHRLGPHGYITVEPQGPFQLDEKSDLSIFFTPRKGTTFEELEGLARTLNDSSQRCTSTFTRVSLPVLILYRETGKAEKEAKPATFRINKLCVFNAHRAPESLPLRQLIATQISSETAAELCSRGGRMRATREALAVRTAFGVCEIAHFGAVQGNMQPGET